jgi:hypothetical protein
VSGEAARPAALAAARAWLLLPAAGGLLPPKALTQDGRATSLRMTDAGSRIGGGSSHYDALVKILLLGNSSVGKTCLLMRFCEVWHAPLRLALSPRC